MKELIYYPWVNVKNENWLKFALLYFDKISPIVPYMNYNRDELFRDKTRQIMDKTDEFFVPYVLYGDEGESVSKSVFSTFIGLIEEKNPVLLLSSSSGIRKRDGIFDLWKQQHDTLLLRGKYTWVFEDYCLKNGFATKADKGIWISENLAYVYMSLLADCIAKNKKLGMVTDKKSYDVFLTNKEQTDYQNKLEKLENNFSLIIPKSMKSIPLEKIIELRGNSTYNDARKQFMKTLDMWLNEKEKGTECSFNDIISCKKEMRALIIGFFGALATVKLTIRMLQQPEGIDLSDSSTLIAGVSKFSGIAKNIHAIHDKYLTRKYYTLMQEL